MHNIFGTPCMYLVMFQAGMSSGGSHLIIVADAADAVSVNFSARCKFSRLNAKIYHFTECIQCTMCVTYANVSLL